MIRPPRLLLALAALFLAGCAATSSPQVAQADVALAGSYRQGDGRILHLLPDGKFFYEWDSDVDVFPPTYDTGAWRERGAEIELTSATKLTGVARAPVRYAVGTLSSTLIERIDAARAKELAGRFEETNRQAGIYNELLALFAVRADDAEVDDGSWVFSGKCSMLVDEIEFSADKIEANRNGTVLKLSGKVHVRAGQITRDIATTTLRFSAGELISVEPRIDLSP